jgi:hypothetical protein
VLYNRGKTANKQLPNESDSDYEKRCKEVTTIVGDRKDTAVIKEVCALCGAFCLRIVVL